MTYTFRDEGAALIKVMRSGDNTAQRHALEAMALIGIPKDELAAIIEPKAVKRPTAVLARMFGEAVSKLGPTDIARISGYIMGRGMRRPDPVCDRRLGVAGFHPEVVYLFFQQSTGGARFQCEDVGLDVNTIGGIGDISATLTLGGTVRWHLSHSGIETITVDEILSETIVHGLVGRPLSDLVGHRMAIEDGPVIRSGRTTGDGAQFVLEGPGAERAAEALKAFETQSVEARAASIANQLGIRQAPPGSGTVAARTIAAIESTLGLAASGTVGRRLAVIEEVLSA